MSFKEIFEIIADNQSGILWAVAICSTLVEIAPIRVSPISWIIKKIGQIANSEILAKLKEQDESINALWLKIESMEAINWRHQILRFNDELLHEVYHSREHFEQMLVICDSYEQYCEAHKDTFKNSVCEMAIDNIKRTYSDCCKKNSFL